MSKIIAVVLATALALSPAVSYGGPAVTSPGLKFGTGPTAWVWGVFGCAGGIIFTAMVANWTQRRQLTLNEAATCGILYWFNPANFRIPGNPLRVR